MREQLLRQALEAQQNKAVSRKAKSRAVSAATSGVPSKSNSRNNSRQTSPVRSKPNSKTSSRAGSRVASEDEDEPWSDDETVFSNGSLTDDPELDGDAYDQWETRLDTVVESVLNRGRRNAEQRESDLRWYIGILQNHVALERIQSLVEPLTKTLLRVASAYDGTLKEPIYALKGLAVTALSDPYHDWDATLLPDLRTLVSRDPSTLEGGTRIQAEALQTLALAAFTTAEPATIAEILPFLLEIVTSDGAYIDAPNAAEVVAAALDALALLVTEAEDIEDSSQDLVAAATEQLESTAPSVQVAAGELIAVLYEKSYRPVDDSDDEDTIARSESGEKLDLVQEYTPYRDTAGVLAALHSISSLSTKRVAKKDRRALHATLSAVAWSLEHPGTGPHASRSEGWKSVNGVKSAPKTGMTVAIGSGRGKGDDGLTLTVDSWWKAVAFGALKKALGSGFSAHYLGNERVRAVFEEDA